MTIWKGLPSTCRRHRRAVPWTPQRRPPARSSAPMGQPLHGKLHILLRKLDHLPQSLRVATSVTTLALLKLPPIGFRLRRPVIRHVRRPSLHTSDDYTWLESHTEIRELYRRNGNYHGRRLPSHRSCNRLIASGGMGAVIIDRYFMHAGVSPYSCRGWRTQPASATTATHTIQCFILASPSRPVEDTPTVSTIPGEPLRTSRSKTPAGAL